MTTIEQKQTPANNQEKQLQTILQQTIKGKKFADFEEIMHAIRKATQAVGINMAIQRDGEKQVEIARVLIHTQRVWARELTAWATIAW